MPKYWGKQIFTHRRFPRSGSKAKDGGEKKKKKKRERNFVITMAKLRMANASTHGARRGVRSWTGLVAISVKKIFPNFFVKR